MPSLPFATFAAKWPKAADKLERDREALIAFFDFPAEHWRHLRTTNPIESSFAGVPGPHPTEYTGAGSRQAALVMAFKLLDSLSQRWRRVNSHHLVAEVLDGATFRDGPSWRKRTTTKRTRESSPDPRQPMRSTTLDNSSHSFQ